MYKTNSMALHMGKPNIICREITPMHGKSVIHR